MQYGMISVPACRSQGVTVCGRRVYQPEGKAGDEDSWRLSSAVAVAVRLKAREERNRGRLEAKQCLLLQQDHR